MKSGVFALSLIGLLAIGQASEAQHITEFTYCGYRASRPREGRAHVVMRVEQTDVSDDKQCPILKVRGRVLRKIKGALNRNDPIAFTVPLGGEGVCYPFDSAPDAFFPDLRQDVVVLLDRYGEIEWMETLDQYDRREAECREPGVVQVR